MAGAEKPHYHGHRERLRQRLIDAGAESLPDYELLEVLLFANNPRGDVKPLAKALLDQFGGFAEVLSADARRAAPSAGPAAMPAIAMLESVREAALRLCAAELRERAGDRLVGQADRLLQRPYRPRHRSRSFTSCSSTAKTR